MSTDNFEIPLTMRRDWLRIQKDLTTIPTLEQHLVHIRKYGISVREAVSIESHFPGLLLPKAPTAFSYQSSGQNVEYSQEAIMEKINSIRKTATDMIVKIIEWIKDRCKVLGQALISGRFKQARAKLNVLNERSDRVTLDMALKAIGDKSAEFFDDRPEVRAVGEIIGVDITLQDMADNLHVNTFTTQNIGYALHNLSGNQGRVILTPDMIKYKIKADIVSTLRAFAIMYGSDSAGVRRMAVDMHAGCERIRNVLSGKTQRTDYSESMRAIENEQFQRDLMQLVTDIGKAMGSFNVNNVDNPRNLDAEDFELQTRTVRETVTVLSEVMQAIHATMKDMTAFAAFASLLLGLSSKELLTNYIRTGRI